MRTDFETRRALIAGLVTAAAGSACDEAVRSYPGDPSPLDSPMTPTPKGGLNRRKEKEEYDRARKAEREAEQKAAQKPDQTLIRDMGAGNGGGGCK